MDRGQNVDRVGAGAGGAPEAAGETPGDTAPRKSSKTKQVVWTVILVILAVGPGLFGVKIYRATSYKRYILAGEKAVAEKRWDNAPTAFRRAMTVQGYAESEEARKALLGIDAAEQKHHYETALAQGNEALSAGSFDNASQAFHRALSVEGFGQSPEPIAGLEKLFETRFGMAREAAGHREVPNIDMVFVLVSEGRFEMGTGGTRHQDGPVHTVTITRPFWVGACEVTQAQFQTVMENNPSRTKGESHPVDQVTFGNAVEFCAKLTEQERGAGRLPQGYVYRLPTEAEWAYAARGGPASKGYTYAGGNDLEVVAWHGEHWLRGSTHPVAQKQPNEIGAFDMSGNAAEWCLDLYTHNAYAHHAACDPTGPKGGELRGMQVRGFLGELRVVRGGGFSGNDESLVLPMRGHCGTDRPGVGVGFRVCLAPAL